MRALLSLPAALAVALVGFATSAFADAQAERANLDVILRRYATQEGKLTTTSTAAQIAAVNTVTATADDLVFAVYELTQLAGDDPVKIAYIAAGALVSPPVVAPAAPTTAKVRADKDKVVGRIIEAAVVASSTSGTTGTPPSDQDTIVKNLLQQLGTINNTLPAAKQLTAAGKQLLVAKALRSTNGLGAAIAAQVQASGFYPTGTTAAAMDTARTAFNVAVLKLLAYKPISNDPAKLATTNTFFPIRDGFQLDVRGEPAFVEGTPPSIFGVRDYIDAALDNYMVTQKAPAALAIATGVAATVPSAAGATIAGYVQDLKNGPGSTNVSSVLIYLKGTSATTSIVANAKLAAAVSDIVADTFALFKNAPTPPTASDAISLATSGTGTGSVAITAALKGKIASGAIRANPLQATAIVNGIIGIQDGAGKMIVPTGIAAFAGAAAQGNSTAGADITKAAVGKIAFVPASGASPSDAAKAAATKADNTKIQAVAIAVGKSLALVDPNKVAGVAESLFDGTLVRAGWTNPFTVSGPNGELARQTLAKDLAVGLATNYAAAGAAVAGVVHQSLVKNVPADSSAALTQIAAVTGLAIKSAAKATVDIALRVASNPDIHSLISGTTSDQLALAMVNNLNVASTNAGAVAAGVSLSDTSRAGIITAAVINLGTTNLAARQAAALTIANTVAINIDVEGIGLVAKSVGELLQPAGSTSKLPKLTTIGTLATSLGKAINTKPLVTWANRVDELGELAAELTKQYLANSGVPNGADAAGQKTLATGLASIGTNIMKSVSAKLLADTANNAADVADIARNVSGAIAQVIANSTKLAGVAKDFLLTSQATGSLIKTLVTAATASKSTLQVTTAFDNVAKTGGSGVYGNYVDPTGGNVTRADASVGRYETGVNYEVGNVSGAETPIKNI